MPHGIVEREWECGELRPNMPPALDVDHDDAPAPRVQAATIKLLPAPLAVHQEPHARGARLHAVVVGGSVAGLCAATALHRIGYKVDVLEQRTTLGETVGGGIVVQPDMISFLKQWTTVDLGKVLIESQGRTTYDARGEVASREDTVQAFSAWDTIWRALRAALPQGVRYHAGTSAASLRQLPPRTTTNSRNHGNSSNGNARNGNSSNSSSSSDEDSAREQRAAATAAAAGTRAAAAASTAAGQAADGMGDINNSGGGDGGGSGVLVTDTSGRGWHADLVVGADGPGSAVRLQLLPGAESRYAGYVGWRGWVVEAGAPPSVRAAVGERFTVAKAHHSHILAYVIPGPSGELAPGKRRLNWVWYVNYTDSELDRVLLDRQGRRRRYGMPHGELCPGVEADVRRLAHRMLPDPFAALVAATPSIFAQSIHDLAAPRLVPPPAGASGGGGGSGSAASLLAGAPVALVGDAAFIVRPHTAAGTTKAAINAWQLASALQRWQQQQQQQQQGFRGPQEQLKSTPQQQQQQQKEGQDGAAKEQPRVYTTGNEGAGGSSGADGSKDGSYASVGDALREYEAGALALGTQLHRLGVLIGTRSQFPDTQPQYLR